MPGPSGGSVLPALAAGARAWSARERSRSACCRCSSSSPSWSESPSPGSADRVAAGVTVAGVNVGGLSAEEAQAKLENVAARHASEPVVFTAAEYRFTIRPAALEVEGNWAAAAEEAVERGDAPFPLRGLERVWLRLFGAEVEPTADVFQAALDERLERIAAQVDRPAVEASLVLDGFEPEIVPGQAGRELDREAAAAVIVAALAGFDREETPLPVVVDSPEVTSQTLEPVARQLRTVLSAPVQLTHQGAVFTIEPGEMVRLLELPSDGASEPPDPAGGRGRAASRTSPAASPGLRATPTSPSGGTGRCASSRRGRAAS